VIYSWKKFILSIMSCLNVPVPKFVIMKLKWNWELSPTWLLVTLSWWQFLDVGDRISILVASFGDGCPSLMLKDWGCWWQKRSKPSPTSQNCHQHISSPTSVINIDAAELLTSEVPIQKFSLDLSNCGKIVLTYNPDYKSCNVPSSN